MPSEGEGACSASFMGCYHLPLRGKLGWMTHASGVKTTLDIESCLPGLPVPSWSPIFLSTRSALARVVGRPLDRFFSFDLASRPRNCHSERSEAESRNLLIQHASPKPHPFTSIALPPQSSPRPAHAPPASPAAVKRHTQTTIRSSRHSA